MTISQADLLHGMQAIADYLGVKRRTAYHMAEKEGLPAFRMAGKLAARRSSLDAWLAAQEAAARTSNPAGA